MPITGPELDAGAFVISGRYAFAPRRIRRSAFFLPWRIDRHKPTGKKITQSDTLPSHFNGSHHQPTSNQ